MVTKETKPTPSYTKEVAPADMASDATWSGSTYEWASAIVLWGWDGIPAKETKPTPSYTKEIKP